jgi:hypothetical protein
MVYRFLLYGGPHDGQALFGPNPWFKLTMDGAHIYRAEIDGAGQPIMEEGDQAQGGGEIRCITADGDTFAPPVCTIRMTYAGAENS